jgi:hypothetical protein
VADGPQHVSADVQTSEASPRRGLKIGAYTVAGFALLAAAGLVLAGPEHHTITGDIQVATSSYNSALGDECVTSGGYDDIEVGAQVVVQDETGRTLATGALEPGNYDGSSCVFDFTLEDIKKAAFYRVSVGREARGGLDYSYDDMVDADWSVHLTLGL